MHSSIRRLSPVAFALACCLGMAPSQAQRTPEEIFVDTVEGCFDDYLALDPSFASQAGGRNDHLTLDLTEEHRSRLGRLYRRCLAELEAIDPSTLPDERRDQAAAYRRQIEVGLRGMEFPGHLLPIVPGASLDSRFAQLGSGDGAHPFRTVEDYDDFLSRAQDFATWVDQAIANLRRGLEQGVTHPREVIERVLPDLVAQARSPLEESPFLRPVERMPASFPTADRRRLQATYRTTIQQTIQPAYGRLAKFLVKEYLPRTRDGISLSELPRGREWYRHHVRFFTTTELEPDAIFELGEAEVRRIRREMELLRRRQGFSGSLREFERALLSDRRAVIPTRRVITTFEDIARRVEKTLPEVVGRTPQIPFEIRQVEAYRSATAGGAFYERPRVDGGELERPGVFYVNLRGAYYPRYTMEALFLHEALPGHHLQIALAQELEELPRFQRYGYFGAYVEGWGLYCESLGEELGLYGDPFQRYGQLTYDLGRASRLIADVGIHHRGWTREEAEAYLAKRGLTWAMGEIQRYAGMPGQALGYKIGELRLRALRQEAEETLGRRFDLAAFHDMILGGGPLPLDVLETRARRWIAERSEGD